MGRRCKELGGPGDRVARHRHPGGRMGPGRRAGRGLRGPGQVDRGQGVRRRRGVAVGQPSRPASASGSCRARARGSPTPGRSTTTVVAETLEEARDNAGFGTPDEHLGLAAPDGVTPAPTSTCGATSSPFSHRSEGRRRPWSWSAWCAPATLASARSSRPIGATRPANRRWRPAPASWGRPGGRRATSRPTPSPARAPTPRPGPGTRSAGPRRRSPWRRRPPTPSTGPPACWAPASRRRRGSRWSSNPASPPPCWPSWPGRSTARRS